MNSPVMTPARQAINRRLSSPSLGATGTQQRSFTRPAADGTQVGGGAPSNVGALNVGGGAPQALNVGGGAPQPQQVGAPPAPSATSTTTTGGGTGNFTTQNVNLPQFRPLNTAPIRAQIEGDAARRQASMDRRTREAFASGGTQFRGAAQQDALNLNQARAFGGVEPALAQLGVSETEMFNRYSPAFANLQLGLAGLNSQNQNSLLNLIPSLLSSMGSFV